MNINKEFACVKHKCVMPCNCYGRSLMALEQAADALATAVCWTKGDLSLVQRNSKTPYFRKAYQKILDALAAYSKARGLK